MDEEEEERQRRPQGLCSVEDAELKLFWQEPGTLLVVSLAVHSIQD